MKKKIIFPCLLGVFFLLVFSSSALAASGTGNLHTKRPTSPTSSNSGGIVELQSAANNKYVSAELGMPGAPLRARADVASTWEKFYLHNNGDGTYSLQSLANHKYVSAELGMPGAPLRARADVASTWEKFYLHNNGDETYSLQSAANYKYVSAELGMGGAPLRARADVASTWEKFYLVQ